MTWMVKLVEYDQLWSFMAKYGRVGYSCSYDIPYIYVMTWYGMTVWLDMVSYDIPSFLTADLINSRHSPPPAPETGHTCVASNYDISKLPQNKSTPRAGDLFKTMVLITGIEHN